MNLPFPNRFTWLLIGLITLFLLQSGCTPIQPPVADKDAAAGAEAPRPDPSTLTTLQVTSPDGAWTATTSLQISAESDRYYQALELAHVSGTPSYTLVDGWFPMGLGYTVATPHQWSSNGSAFYYTNRPQADGCGLLFNGSDLYRVDLATGAVTELLPPDTTTVLALAPDEQHVAFRAIGAPLLLIRDLESGQDVSIDLEAILGADQMGSIVWSNDSRALAFAIAHDPCSGGWAASTSIYTLDIDTLGLEPRLNHDERLLLPVAWAAPEQLHLESIRGERFSLELTTGAVTPLPATSVTSAVTSTATSNMTEPLTATGTLTR